MWSTGWKTGSAMSTQRLDQAPIAVTSGEPAGIGPDICLMLASRVFPRKLVVLADRNLLADRARQLRLAVPICDYRPSEAAPTGTLKVIHVPLLAPCSAGKLDPANARYVLALIERAMAGCRSGEFAAMVTAPVHKGVINDAGIAFSGHTEYLDEKSGAAGVVMMLVGGGMRVALATTHVPLAEVPRVLSRESLEKTLRIIFAELSGRFGIAAPRVLVAGLNPHSGESGHLGREEIEVIAPVIERLRGEGLRLEGPIPADTLFVPTRLQGADCVLAMYHDQGLPVLKYASFGGGTNITLGLPFVRTSVDHGTALDLAAKGGADPGSLYAAVDTAIALAAATSGRS
jgi:4-hydroxythreonine-4-phosphate dehydrogenase